ncbi:hypothetical protein GGI10_001591 [Coemansia sp. RSA 2530]|nr:hypothetical protein GGI10_001591 [Coemansia sp. RSA 2530]
MFARQHPTYRRLSGQFGRQRSHQNERRHYSQAEEIEKPALSSHDFVDWERIGRGGFGKVYRAKRRQGNELVAVKVVDKRALKDKAAELRLAAEVAIHESLSHGGVVQLYDSFEDERFVYLVMEHCSGGDLWRYLKQRGGGGELAALAEGEARHVMRQTAGAVAYLHAHGVLHRDLKLANILLTQSMDVRVADFGLATWVGHIEPTTMCGTPSYISPEILARQPYGLEADVWALGCLLVTLLTGSQPFRDAGRRITEDVVAGIRLPRDVSEEARSLVRGLLRIDPAARIRSERILDHPFFALSSTRLPTTKQLEEEEEKQRHARRFILPQRQSVEYDRKPNNATVLLGRHDEPRSTNGRFNRRSAEIATYTVPANEGLPRRQAAAATGNAAPDDDREMDLSNFSTARLQPLKRSMKNGKVYLRADHLLVLDLTSNPTLVALNENTREIYEFKRPLLHLDALTSQSALRIHPWTLELPAIVAKAVRVAIRCVTYLLGQQRRIKISTPQGKGWMFDDGTTFKFTFFNGIKIEIAQRLGEATVEIPSNHDDLPNEIQKIPLSEGDDSRVPGKIRGVLAHARQALHRVAQFDSVLREFEDGGSMAASYEGQIAYPVELAWEWDVTGAIDYVPPGLRKRSSNRAAVPMSMSNTAGSTTVVTATLAANNANGRRHGAQRPIREARADSPPPIGRATKTQPKQQWGAHLLDRRTVDDTPTRRLNLGPITRLVEEFNHPPTPAKQYDRYNVLRTPGSPLVLRTPANPASKMGIHEMAQQTFQNACFIPDVGWCMAATEDESDPDDYLITLLFCDGCRVLVRVKDQIASYKDKACEYMDLPFDHSMPVRVKERLSWLPQFLSIMGLGM